MKNICLYLEADQRALITGHHGPAHAPARAEDVAAAELVPQLGRLEDQSEVSIAMMLTNESSVFTSAIMSARPWLGPAATMKSLCRSWLAVARFSGVFTRHRDTKSINWGLHL